MEQPCNYNTNFKTNPTARLIKVAEVPFGICGQTETMDSTVYFLIHNTEDGEVGNSICTVWILVKKKTKNSKNMV